MIQTSQELAEQYKTALEEYLAGAGEDALRRAYQLGRKAMADGLGVLEMAAIHHKSLAAILAGALTPQERVQAAEWAAHFFAESLSSFEMALRGFQEANTALRHNLKELQGVGEELQRQNQQLAAAQLSMEAEHQRYRELFDFAPDGYLVTNLEGTIQEANSAVAALFQVSQRFLTGVPLILFVAPEDHESFHTHLTRLQSGSLEKVENWQIRMQPQQGAPYLLALNVGIVRNTEGRLVGLRWLLRDITERKRIEEERAQLFIRELVARAEGETARRLAFLAEASTLLAASLDYETTPADVARLAVPYLADWSFVYLVEEPELLRQLAVAHADPAKAELVSRLQRRYPPGTKVPYPMNKVMRTGKSEMVLEVTETWLEALTSDAEHLRLVRELNLRCAMVVPLLVHGRSLGVIAFAAGDSGRRYSSGDLELAEELARRCSLAVDNARLYQQVVAERDRAAKASQAKDEFVAILSHELRNPLMPILGWARVLKNQSAIIQDPVLSGGVESLERNAQNIARLAEDCLDLTRISERKVQLEKEALDLNQVVEAAAGAAHELAHKKGLHFVLQLSPSRLMVSADKTRLEQVMMNVFTNAIKYTGNGDLVSVYSQEIENEAEVAVQDTGMGIPAELLEQIFQPFRRGTAGHLTSESGLGLGLAICQHMVQMHGGRIWAESPGPGCGSTFRIRLPLLPALATPPVPDQEKLATPQKFKALRVLIIEDSQDVLSLIKFELGELGYSVLTATDGESGLEMARLELPDVIVSDIKMPGMDGYELIRRLRLEPELASKPAIALTGFGMQKDIKRAMAAGYNTHLRKPVDPRELSSLIQQLISKQN